MKTSQTGLRLIEKYEGLILQSYDDANERKINAGDHVKGVLTIGYGHTSSAGGPKVYPGQVITKAQAEELLAGDLGRVERDVERLVKVPINQNQFDALVSFHFNTGGLGKSSLLKKLNAGDYQGAAQGLMAWTKASQIGPGPIPGLVRRRNEEKALFLSQVKTIPPKTTAGAGTAVVVGAGGAVAASQSSVEYWPYIIIGTAVAVFVGWLGVRWYKTRIQPKVNVDVKEPVAKD